MAYASYGFYTGTYKGQAIEQEEWPRLALRASHFLDYYTMGRAKDSAKRKELKMACCALAEQYLVIDQAEAMAHRSLQNGLTAVEEGGEIQSESVGSWSVSRRGGGESAKAAREAAQSARDGLAGIAWQYLAGTGLLYRGVMTGCTHHTR